MDLSQRMKLTAGRACHGRARVLLCACLITGTLGQWSQTRQVALKLRERAKLEDLFLVSQLVPAKRLFSNEVQPNFRKWYIFSWR